MLRFKNKPSIKVEPSIKLEPSIKIEPSIKADLKNKRKGRSSRGSKGRGGVTTTSIVESSRTTSIRSYKRKILQLLEEVN